MAIILFLYSLLYLLIIQFLLSKLIIVAHLTNNQILFIYSIKALTNSYFYGKTSLIITG